MRETEDEEEAGLRGGNVKNVSYKRRAGERGQRTAHGQTARRPHLAAISFQEMRALP
ncbi:hypothetical protein WN55_09324 [Dufourea novaeangliae]|uniref:Uncharacterized protein n=1 Tax=Dufourea novaeangliae TaxID=178035 RepID=A0A154PB54_DUFNO|nr:hypothetical protein WN55_09324 [Dufourea novaeangliae]